MVNLRLRRRVHRYESLMSSHFSFSISVFMFFKFCFIVFVFHFLLFVSLMCNRRFGQVSFFRPTWTSLTASLGPLRCMCLLSNPVTDSMSNRRLGLRVGDEERRLMHLVPAPAVRLMKRRVQSRPGVRQENRLHLQKVSRLVQP